MSPYSLMVEIEEIKRELEYKAYQGWDTAVYELYYNTPLPERKAFQSISVLNSVLSGGIALVKRYRTVWQHAAAAITDDVIADIERDLDHFIQHCARRKYFPRELFERILDWHVELMERARTVDALRLLVRTEELPIRIYPDLYSRLVLKQADILFQIGRIRESHQVLSTLVERYYIIPDRNTLSEILMLYCRISLLNDKAWRFKELLLCGLRCFYTHAEMRRLFTGLFASTYRRAYRVFLDRDLLSSDKLLFLLHWIDYIVDGTHLLTKIRIAKATRLGVLGYLYAINYVLPRGRTIRLIPAAENRSDDIATIKRQAIKRRATRKNILITRAMGGIGDLLTMTPGFHALKKKYTDHDIHLAIPAAFAPLFAGNDDVTLLDIEAGTLDVSAYAKWFNFTDCPAARFESRKLPRVKTSRIDIFAKALGVRGMRLRGMDKRPRYFISVEEKAFQKGFWTDHGLDGRTVIGVQLKAAESYKDYPNMDMLVRRLASEFKVVLFHAGPREIPSSEHVVDPGARSIRQAFALAAGCDAIIAPDSAFVHFAGAFDIPCVALEGPIGKIGTTYYPSCTAVDVTRVLKCIPCWRNEVIPCRLTNLRDSACMKHITIEAICNALHATLARRARQVGAR